MRSGTVDRPTTRISMVPSSLGTCGALLAWKRTWLPLVTFWIGVASACETCAALPLARTLWPSVETMVRPRAASAVATALMSAGRGPYCARKSAGCSHWWYCGDDWSCIWVIRASSWSWWRSGR